MNYVKVHAGAPSLSDAEREAIIAPARTADPAGFEEAVAELCKDVGPAAAELLCALDWRDIEDCVDQQARDGDHEFVARLGRVTLWTHDDGTQRVEIHADQEGAARAVDALARRRPNGDRPARRRGRRGSTRP